MKSVLRILALMYLIILCNCFAQPVNDNNPEITAGEIKGHISYLASDELEGRLTGTKGLELAAEYIAAEFKKYSLLPFFDDKYFQEYPFISGLDATKNNIVELEIAGKKYELELNKDFIPAPFTDNLEVSGGIVFVGYSISSKELKYDDFEGIDVKDKIVLAYRYNPDVESPKSKFDKYSDLRLKAKTAKDRGAKAVIFVNGFIPKDDEDSFTSFKYDSAPGIKDLAAIQIKRSFAEKIFEAEDVDFKEYQSKINESKKPASFILKNTKVTIRTEVNPVESKGLNVAGYLQGSDPVLKNEYVIIGAHFDHLGYGETGSLYRGKDKQIHNGADDNASGTTGVLELAEKFSSEKDKLKRSVIFVAFSGEELGLLGSNYFAQNLPVPTKNVAAMINMDMIGRLNEEQSLMVYGAGTSKIWKEMLNNFNKDYNFKLAFNDEGFGPSDHTSFYSKEIPVLFFWTGTHSDYHRPSDDAETINNSGEEKVLKYVYQVADYIDNLDTKPDYVNIPRKDMGTGSTSFKVYIGTTPDFGAQVDGYKISGVTEGSPAQKAGMKAGDIIIDFGGKKISNIYDYMYAMNEYAPGDKVDIVVLRGEEKLTLKLELAAK